MDSNEMKTIKVWNLQMKDGSIAKAVTIEHGERKPSMCYGCSAPCCRGMFRPILTGVEFESKHFPISFTPVPIYIKAQVPQVQYLITLAVDEKKGCPYFNPEGNKCTIWPNCPKACLAYDCREDNRPEIKNFIKQRRKEWKKKDKWRYLVARNSLY